MTTELIALQNELQLAKQQNEIMHLRYELQKSQVQKASRLEDSLFSASLYEHYQKVAIMMSKSEIVPTSYRGKPADILIAMEMGYQLGLPVAQSLQDIAVINGRPCLWGDGLLSLALNHRDCESIAEDPLYNDNGQIVGYRCTVIRKGHKPHTKEFTLQDASAAGLLNRGVWKTYPSRMLQMRARSFALRDKFADALRGLRVVEIEEEDAALIEGVAMSQPTGLTQTERLKQTINGHKNDQITHETIESTDDITDQPIDSSPTLQADEIEHPTGVAKIGDEKDALPESNQSDKTISEDQIKTIHALTSEKKLTNERFERVLAYYRVTNVDGLTHDKAALLIKQLETI